MSTTQGAATDALFKNRGAAQFAWLFEITRSDGLQYRYTNHDQSLADLRLVGEFQPGLTNFARRRVAGLGERTTEIRGLVGIGTGSNEITFTQLEQGRFNGAIVFELLKDWRYPFWSWGILANVYDVSGIEYDVHEWRMQLTGVSSRLNRKIGDIYAKRCQNQLGLTAIYSRSSRGAEQDYVVSRCNPAGLPGSGLLGAPYLLANEQVKASPAPTARFLAVPNTNAFTGILAINDRYAFGRVEFLTGNLAGLTIPIESSQDTGPAPTAGDLEITFLRSLPQAPASGDLINIYAGCDKTIGTCSQVFGNNVHYRGAPHIPGTGQTLKTGDAN